MAVLHRTFTDPVTYRRLAYLLVGVPLGVLWLVVMATLWNLSIGLIVTPLVVPAALALAYATRTFAAVESDLARGLLGVDVRPPRITAAGDGWRARLRALFGEGFWRTQGYLWLRWLLGFPAGLLIAGLLAGSLALISGPLWLPSAHIHGGPPAGPFGHAQIGPFGHGQIGPPHSLALALALVPVGLLGLPATVALARAIGGGLTELAALIPQDQAGRTGLSSAAAGPARAGRALAGPSRRGVVAHAAISAGFASLLVVIWAATSFGYFWPVWALAPLAVLLGIHAWLYLVWREPRLARRFHGSRALAAGAGCAALVWLLTVMVWAPSGGYFWPLWTLVGLAALVGLQAVVVTLSVPAQMADRIETLTSSRAGVVDVQGSELRRIERDLHDGAQARLVSLGMSLGMAEQKLTEDPARAAELLAEARAGAEAALRELRALARGIHPPVLTDRGLQAAVTALADSTPMHVALSVDVPVRPPSAVETAAYFVVAEALANAAKHSRSDWLDIRIATVGRHLELEIRDDGVGGADANGSGLVGLRQRVEALDGRLELTSPLGGPTTLYAELPCL
jgi:signal transduction histidine kinase